MDNLCHTLAGAALGEAGLKERTAYGSAALMIAANLPDIDVLSFAFDTPAVALRRGWTHGVLAQALLPIALACGFWLFDRRRPPGAGRSRVRLPAMLALCYIGVLSHVGMDWLNNYGVRLLMPFSPRWFYGDSVFIIDPWLWLALAAGVVLARRRRAPGAAQVAIAVAAAYIAIMVALSRAAHERVSTAWTAATGQPPAQVMIGPVPVDPLRKTVVIDAGDRYEQGTFSWWPPGIRFSPDAIPKNASHPAARQAAAEPDVRAFLVWSRFPYFEIQPSQDGTIVTVGDVRFADRGMFKVRTTLTQRPTPNSQLPRTPNHPGLP